MATSRTQPQAPSEEWGDEISGGRYIDWNSPKVVIGIVTDGKVKVSGKYATPENPGYEVALTQDDGEQVRFNCPSALATRMKQIENGTRVRIQYDGKTVKSAAGRDVKEFSVRTARDMAAAAAAAFPQGGQF